VYLTLWIDLEQSSLNGMIGSGTVDDRWWEWSAGIDFGTSVERFDIGFRAVCWLRLGVCSCTGGANRGGGSAGRGDEGSDNDVVHRKGAE